MQLDSLLISSSNLFCMFPNVKIKAAYFPLHQIVELSDIDQQTFDSALLGNSLRTQLVGGIISAHYGVRND